MDHMRISGTEPSSVILSQTMYFEKSKRDALKVPKQAEAIRDGVINPKKLQFQQIITDNFDALKMCRTLNDRKDKAHFDSSLTEINQNTIQLYVILLALVR